ncbi:MAG TPA: methyltransferase domain-containing protein [Saprospiraceae bacterium]|nr:methyltransferase domain-containing protein [Saprospiraceae bacterium]
MSNTIKENWYEDFFKGINCELWDKAVSPEWTQQEVDFLISELEIVPGQSILDIPCGNGRHSIGLANKGFQVTGVDISVTFLNDLRDKIKSESLNIKTIHADILAVELTEKYAGAICMGNSFGYFSMDKMHVFIQKVADSLETGGRFIINSGMIAESIIPNFSQFKSFTVQDIKMDIVNTYFVLESYMTSEIVYTKNGHIEEEAFKHYIFTLGEINRLLKMYGLKIIACYNSPTKTEYILGDPQIYIVAVKE